MVEGDGLTTSRSFVNGRSGKWFAWHDFASGRTPTLYVTGECAIEIPGARVVLRRGGQGANPRILVLDKVVLPSLDPPPDGGFATSVRYDEATAARYTQVSIQPDDVLVDVVVSL